MTTMIFIRHGHSEANRDFIFGGNTDVDLTETGILQAEKMAGFVLSDYKVDAVYSSSLIRAVKTAEKIAKPLGLDIHSDKRLMEIFGGEWDGLPFSEIEKKWRDEYDNWRTDMSKVQTPNGENVFDVQKRAWEAIREIGESNDGKTVVVVAHRVMLRTIQCIWEKRPLSEINECEWLPNCSISELLYKDGELIPVIIGRNDFIDDSINTPASGTM